MKKNKFTSLFLSLALCLMLCVSLFAGCTLVTKDMSKYYSAVVASFTYDNNEKIDITKKELITAYNSYGYQYVQSYNMETSEAYKLTIQNIIDTKLIVKASEDLSKENNGGEVLTSKEKTYLWEMTFETIQDNLESYYNDINNIDTSDQQEESSDGVVSESDYQPTAILVPNGDGTYTIQLKKTTKTEMESHTFWSSVDRDIEKQNDLDALYLIVVDFVRDNPIYSQAYNKYLNEAKKSEDGLNLATDNKSVFERELKRIYEIIYENFMVTKYAESHQTLNSSVTVANILELYQSKVISDYNKYVTENSSSYENDVLSNVGSINYFKTQGTQFFYISHILAKFSDGQQSLYDDCMKVINGESDKYTIGEAQGLIEDLYKNLTFPVREKNDSGDWVDTGKTKSVEAVMQELELKLATAGDNEYLKAEYFQEFIYKYNQDDGMFNSTNNYVIGIDYTTPDEEAGTNYTVYSNMVDSFTDAAIELYDQGNAKIGDVYSEQIRSEYGIHIMIYEGKVQNLFTGIDEKFTLTTSDIEILNSNSARIKAGEDKTLFDSLFDELNSDRYSIFESMNLQFLRDEVNITFYPDAYKDLT